LTTARAEEPGQVAGLGQDRRSADRGQPVDGGHQVSELELAEDGDHPGLDGHLVGAGSFPVDQDPANPLQRGLPVFDHAGGGGDGREDLPDDPQARLGLARSYGRPP
jgi:hypothetical protein